MKENYKKILIGIFVFLIIILLSFSIIIANNNYNNNINEEKIYYEIKDIDKQLNYMFNLVCNKSYINWYELTDSIEQLYNYWNSTILDINNLEIDKKHLTNFGKILDNMLISINNQNKEEIQNDLLQLYNNLIIYSETLNYDKSYTNILYVKYNVLKANLFVEKENWTLAYENITKGSEYLYNIVNSIENNKYKQYNINQAYVSIKELENIINTKDENVFYTKVKIIMGKLENI